jgi:hypothetical protein
MKSATQRALARHRRRRRQQGLARVEVQVPRGDADLVRAVARRLRDGDVGKLRAQLAAAVAPEPEDASILDLIACDLPDEAFEPMLRRDRRLPRRVDL